MEERIDLNQLTSHRDGWIVARYLILRRTMKYRFFEDQDEARRYFDKFKGQPRKLVKIEWRSKRPQEFNLTLFDFKDLR